MTAGRHRRSSRPARWRTALRRRAAGLVRLAGLGAVLMVLCGGLLLVGSLSTPAHADPSSSPSPAVPVVDPAATTTADPTTAPAADPTATGSTGSTGSQIDSTALPETGVGQGDPSGPQGPSGPRNGPAGGGGGAVTIDVGGLADAPSSSVTIILVTTLLSLAPAILLTCTSFTKILVVLGLTRNALGLQQIPPTQVLVGLALFLSLFVMKPVLSQINDDAVQPYRDGQITAHQAYDAGVGPLRSFMLHQTGDQEINLLSDIAGETVATKADVPMTTLVPAFILSELKQAFIIGFIVFVPFLVIDIVVSGALMALGMMMMPPVVVSLPFKLLLFVMVDGWGLVVTALVQSYQAGAT